MCSTDWGRAEARDRFAVMSDPTAVLSSQSSGKRLLPWLVAVAFFMESLDTTILNTAVPAIADALRVVPLSMKSVLSSYTLSLAVFIPVSGWMADKIRHAACVRVRHWPVHVGVIPLRD